MTITPQLIPGSPIMIVGEAPGKTEEAMGRCFVGAAGEELNSWLSLASLSRSDISITNVFHQRPPNNDLKSWQISKKAGGVGCPIAKGKHFPVEKYQERERLYKEIAQVSPNLIIALGNTACWALLDKSGIAGLRGFVFPSSYCKAKVLPTYHPAAVLRQYSLRPVAVMDFLKATREASSPTITLPNFEIHIPETISELRALAKAIMSLPLISYDIETAAGQITCIGFAGEGFGICIPFVNFDQPDRNYWSEGDEILAYKITKEILSSPPLKVTQNGLYDLQYLRKYGISPANTTEDTMLLAHSLQPELPKSLAFLASIYTDFPAWKSMRPHSLTSNKKEE